MYIQKMQQQIMHSSANMLCKLEDEQQNCDPLMEFKPTTCYEKQSVSHKHGIALRIRDDEIAKKI
jgi:hypothetical protein